MSALNFAVAAIGAKLAGYLDNISRLPELWREDPFAFWLTSASLLLIALLLVLAFVAAARRDNRRRRLEEQRQKVKRFVPVESSDADIDTVFLPLDQRIIACRGGLDQDTVWRILAKAPQSLQDVVAAFDKSDSGVRGDLTRLVRENRLLETYNDHLDDPLYPLGVLVDAWARFPDHEVLRGFVELLSSPKEASQMQGVRLLSAIQEPKTLSILMMALVQPARYVPARVAEVFVSMPNQSGPLLAYMLPEIDDKYKMTVLEIIGQTHADFPPEKVLACLKHHNYHIRVAACGALGEGRIAGSTPELIIAAHDKKWQVRAAAAKALGQVGDLRAISILEALAQDKEGWVAASAQEALKVFAEIRNSYGNENKNNPC